MLQRIREQIRVAVIHGPGTKIRPVWFDWNRRKHEVKEVTYIWHHHCGRDHLLHFSVHDGTALYELIYNNTQRFWILESIDADKA